MTRPLILILISLFCNCILYSQTDNEISNMNPMYFESPAKAIPVIRDLIISSDWKTLSRYYDLKNSAVKMEDLLNGSFFIRDEKPEMAHPGGFWKYKHPFPPAFRYLSSIEVEDHIYKVEMDIEIDQGSGETQRGWMNFYMIESEKGFQILPELLPDK